MVVARPVAFSSEYAPDSNPLFSYAGVLVYPLYTGAAAFVLLFFGIAGSGHPGHMSLCMIAMFHFRSE